MPNFSGVVAPTEGARIEISADGGATWKVVPGVASIIESGGDNPTRETTDFQGVSQQVGQARPPTLEVAISGYGAAKHSAFAALRAAKIARSVLHFRWTTAEQVVFARGPAGNTAAIAAADGAVTFAGNNQPKLAEPTFGPGDALKSIAGNGDVTYYTIETIDEDGDAVVEPRPANNVQASAYEIVVPGLRRPSFAARVPVFGNAGLESESNLSTSLTLAPLAVLPDLEIAR